jgi:Fic family protein
MRRRMAILYDAPTSWISYDLYALVGELTEAKAAVLSLTAIPFQRSWAENLQAIELKREVAGTSKIEGADFTDRELDEALTGATPEDKLTRSQRQARAAINTYRWIGNLPHDFPVDEALVRQIHLRIVTGCDDDHCCPGELRSSGQNVGFGLPTHRGAEGGAECLNMFRRLCGALNQEFRAHDPLIQALALHYHLGAMHPFQDGNGRTARAVEALILQRSQLKDALFIAMSNYYYDEKTKYLSTLSEVRQRNYDLTPFLKFGLSGIALQCQRLLKEIRAHVQKALFRDVMGRMYGRLRSPRKRGMGRRQCELLNRLLDRDLPIDHLEFYEVMGQHYTNLHAPGRAYVRDLNQLSRLGAISVKKSEEKFLIQTRPEWATEITESLFYQQINQLPSAKTRLVITSWD